MAENNNPIRGSYPSGTPQDVSAIVSVLSDLKTDFKDINNVLQQIQNNMNPKDSNSRNVVTPRNLENLFKKYIYTGSNNRTAPSSRNFINSMSSTIKCFKDLDAEIKQYGKDLKNVNSSGLIYELQRYSGHLGDELNKMIHTISGSDSELSKLASQITQSSKQLTTSQNLLTQFELIQEQTNRKMQELHKQEADLRNKLNSDLSKEQRDSIQLNLRQIANQKEQLVKDRAQYDKKIAIQEQTLETERSRNEELTQRFQTSKEYHEQLQRLEQNKIESARDILSISSNLTSRTAQLLPESVQQLQSYKKSFREFFNPKQKDEFQSYVQEYNDTLDRIQSKRDDNNITEEELTNNLEIERANNEELKEILNKAKLLQDETLVKDTEARLQESTRQLEIYNLELDRIEHENELLDAQEEQVEEEFKQINKTFTFTKSFLGTIGKGIENVAKSALDKFTGDLQNSANSVFDSFENMQRSIGRTLKMSAGAYDDFAEQMADIAHEAGLAVDVTQLNEAAANMVDLGVRDNELIQGLALGQAYIAESGSSVKLDEETIKQLQAQYFESINNGATKQDAAKQVTSMIQGLIGAEQWVANTYGSTSALASGGSESIQQYLNRVLPTGMADEHYAEFYGQMASSMQAMERLGLDSATIMQDLDSLMENPMSQLSTDMKSWLGNNNLGISSTQDLYAALQAGQGGDIMTSIAQWKANLLGNMDATSVAFAKGTYGMNETVSQALALQQQGENTAALYNSPEISEISDTWDRIEGAIEKGDYLSATEKLEKTEIDWMTDIAQNAQQIVEGKFWMDTGLGTINSIVNGAVAKLFTGIGGVFGGLGTGGGSSIGLGTVGTGLKNFAFGNMDTPIGKIGTYGTMGVGGVMSAYSAISNFVNADSFSEGLIDTFRDTTFTSGLGTTIGGAIAGPIGGAVGGMLGKLVPEVSTKLEDLLTSFIEDSAEYEEERNRKNTEQMQKAAESLEDAANSHKQTAEDLQADLNAQKDTFNTMTEQEKEAFLARSGLTKEERENLLKSGDTNALFDAAVQSWQKQIEKEQLLAEGASTIKSSLGSTIGVDNVSNYTKKQIKGMSDKELIKAGLSAGMSEEDAQLLTTMSANDAMAALNAAEEHKANLSTFMAEQGGEDSFMSQVQKYAELNGITDLSKAAVQYVQEVSPDLYDDKQLKEIGKLAADYTSLSDQYGTANDEFHDRISKIIQASGGNINTYDDLFHAYKSAYPNFEWGAVQGSDILDGHYVIDGNENFNSSNFPNLRYKHSGAIGYDYDPDLYVGKYKTGLNYVPMDDYMALLHQGEMVLNASEANYYRSQLKNPVAARSLSSMSDEKADKIIEILNKMLQVMVSRTTSGRSNLPKSLVQMNSNISVY